MNENPLVSFLVITMRPDEAKNAVESCLNQDYDPFEVIVIANVATGAYEQMVAEYGSHEAVSVYEETERQGPPGARNEGVRQADGDILVTIDDDAVLRSQDALTTLTRIFRENPDVGAVSFRSVVYGTDEAISIEIPRGPNGKHPDETYRTTYFVGVGAAFRRKAMEAVEGFPEEFFYYMEELDLSFQLMKAGYEILYTADIVVEHKQTGAGRPTADQQWELTLQNRIRVSVRHLPWRHVVVSTLVWTLYTLFKTRLSIPTVYSAYRVVYDEWCTLREQREVVDTQTRKRIAELGGRLWY